MCFSKGGIGCCCWCKFTDESMTLDNAEVIAESVGLSSASHTFTPMSERGSPYKCDTTGQPRTPSTRLQLSITAGILPDPPPFISTMYRVVVIYPAAVWVPNGTNPTVRWRIDDYRTRESGTTELGTGGFNRDWTALPDLFTDVPQSAIGGDILLAARQGTLVAHRGARTLNESVTPGPGVSPWRRLGSAAPTTYDEFVLTTNPGNWRRMNPNYPTGGTDGGVFVNHTFDLSLGAPPIEFGWARLSGIGQSTLTPRNQFVAAMGESAVDSYCLRIVGPALEDNQSDPGTQTGG